MTSSKFSRRPRVQPEPKACKVGPKPLPPPLPPPPPPWPAPTMLCRIDWDAPEEPLSNWHIHESCVAPWHAVFHRYSGAVYDAPDEVHIRFYLDLDTAAAHVLLRAYRSSGHLWDVYSDDLGLEVGAAIDITITEWNDLPEPHTLICHFST